MNEVRFFLLFKTLKGNLFSSVGLCPIKMARKIDMSNLTRMLLMILVTIAITACATTSVQQSYITIRQPEVLLGVNVGEKFEVLPGDSLKILETKPCAEGKGICWKVSSANTGKVGFVNAESIQQRQEIYIEEAGRIFSNNTIHSKYPAITININPEFHYLGSIKGKDLRATYYKYKDYMYMFAASNIKSIKDIRSQNLSSLTQENQLEKGLQIIFRELAFRRKYFSDYQTTKIKNKLYEGVEQYANKDYEYYIKKIYLNPKSRFGRFLYDNGYILPSCLLVKALVKVIGNRRNVQITIAYFEDINEQGFSCSAFPINGVSLDEEEIKFIEEFNERSKLPFEIVHSQ